MDNMVMPVFTGEDAVDAVNAGAGAGDGYTVVVM